MSPRPVPTLAHYCMDARAGPQHHAAVRVLTHIKKLYDCLGQFLVRMICDVARAERSSPRSWRVWLVIDPQGARAADALLEVREESCRSGGGREAQAARSARRARAVSVQQSAC